MLQVQMTDLLAITSMLPLFYEKADTPAIIRHPMDVIRSVTEFLSLGRFQLLPLPKPNIFSGHGQVTMVRTKQ